MTIIPDVYEKFGIVLNELLPEIGPDRTFSAEEVVRRYEAKFPGDRDVMKKRQESLESSHSLAGYLNGMLSEYARNTKVHGPRIERIGECEYRFV